MSSRHLLKAVGIFLILVPATAFPASGEPPDQDLRNCRSYLDPAIGVPRLSGEPHDLAECERDPDAYFAKIVGENMSIIERRQMRKQLEARKQRARRTPLDPGAKPACRDAVRRHAQLPAEAEVSLKSVSRQVRGNGTVVRGEVDLFVFGAMIPHTFRCLYEDGAVAAIETELAQ